jgi:hypothetical protein
MPVRIPSSREKILALADTIRERFADPFKIDDVAVADEIILVRTAGPAGKDAGFAHVHFIREPVFIDSLARPGERSEVWGRENKRTVRSVVINSNAGVPEREVFWHEYYHLFHSPKGIQRSERFEHHYSTEGVLHHQEERRADEFAAAVLVHPIEECLDAAEIMERFGVSQRLAICALRFAKQLAADRE